MKHTPVKYTQLLSGSENHKGYNLWDAKGNWVANVSPIDTDGIEGKEICEMIIGSGKLLEENESLKAINNQLLEALKNYTNEVNHGDLDKARELYHGLEFILSQHIEQAGL